MVLIPVVCPGTKSLEPSVLNPQSRLGIRTHVSTSGDGGDAWAIELSNWFFSIFGEEELSNWLTMTTSFSCFFDS